MVASGRARTNLAVLHLLSAARFAARAGEVEARHGTGFGRHWEEAFAYATATVLASVASLESYINEIFADRDVVFPDLPARVISKLWDAYEQRRTLEKYDLALDLKHSASLDHGSSPYQEAQALISLRNGLVHFRPEWHDEQDKHRTLSSTLRSRIPSSPYFDDSESLFPRGWVSYKAAKWSLEAAIALMLEVDVRLVPVAPRVSHHVGRVRSIADGALDLAL